MELHLSGPNLNNCNFCFNVCIKFHAKGEKKKISPLCNREIYIVFEFFVHQSVCHKWPVEYLWV
jgi:hypothetical protein